MIYRKWSLATGPAAIIGGIVATIAIANLFIDDPFRKPAEKKLETTKTK